VTCKILLNEHTCGHIERTDEWMRMFLRAEEQYFNDLLTVRGYVYLNQIYEALEVAWDPKNENPCCIYDLDGVICIKFKIRKVKNGFNLTITW
jgi:hypothetical protein